MGWMMNIKFSLRASKHRTDGRLRLWKLTFINVSFLGIIYSVQEWISGAYWWHRILLEMPQFPLSLPTLFLFVQSLRRRYWLLTVNNFLMVMLFLFLFMGFNVPFGQSTDSETQPIRVMSYNIQGRVDHLEAIAKVIIASRANVVCLQEVHTTRTGPDLVKKLHRFLPGWFVREQADVATFTRYPIVSASVFPLTSRSDRIMLETVLDVHGRPLAVLNLHYAVRPQDILRRQMSFLTYLRHKASLAQEQTVTILRVASSKSAPLLLVGDFNNPPRGRYYHLFSSRYTDAFRASGWGWGYTLTSRFPYTRIDYIWLSKDIKVQKCEVLNTTVSDHRPLIAEITL
jgi:endonuclease/exonuclease/phosphatase family metal-dependent hydrolase